MQESNKKQMKEILIKILISKKAKNSIKTFQNI